MITLHNTEGVKLSHEVMVKLRNEGVLGLGIRDDLAERITQIRGLGPTKTCANSAFKFWNLVGFCIFLYLIYVFHIPLVVGACVVVVVVVVSGRDYNVRLSQTRHHYPSTQTGHAVVPSIGIQAFPSKSPFLPNSQKPVVEET
jgi:hypothetical protein